MLMGLFDGIDFWFQYKWQARGSGYVYGFLWSLIAPKPDPSTGELRAAFVKHWAAFISVINSN